MTTSSSDTPTGTETPATISAPTGDIVARAGKYYRNTRYVISIGLFLMGLWFVRDGFFVWPKENADAVAKAKAENKALVLPHPGWDVPLNKLFGVTLPPLALILLARWLYISRGEYRLSGQTLHVPGHPPVPFEMITALDKRQWDRKGIAYVQYEVAGKHSSLKLDDFIYEREPTDKIYDEIVKFVNPPGTENAPGGFPVQPESETKTPES
jgi:hypothetical protein